MVGINTNIFSGSKRLNRLSKTFGFGALHREEARRKALFQMGEKYLFGHDGETKDQSKSIMYFKQAAARGYMLASSVLGFCYEFGMGVDIDFLEAERLYIEAAECEDGFGQARLAFLRKYGRPGVKIDRNEASAWEERVALKGISSLEWLIRAAEIENEPSAQYVLGVCYHDGVAVEKNAKLAVQCESI